MNWYMLASRQVSVLLFEACQSRRNCTRKHTIPLIPGQAYMKYCRSKISDIEKPCRLVSLSDVEIYSKLFSDINI